MTKSPRYVKTRILFRQNINLLICVVAWFTVNYIIWLLQPGIDANNAVEYLFYFKVMDNEYGNFYSKYSEFIMYGLVLGMVNFELMRKYNPRMTGEALASKMHNHAVIFGYNNLGIKIINLCKENNIPVVISSKNEDSIIELIEKEQPAIVYDEKDETFMKKVNMAKAKYFFLTENDHFVNLGLIGWAREQTKTCTIAARVLDEELVPIYESYKCELISTSAHASEKIFSKYLDEHLTDIHFIGFNHFAENISKVAVEKGIKCHFIENDLKDIYDYNDYINTMSEQQKELLELIEGNYMDRTKLAQSGFFNSQAIIITEDLEGDLIFLTKILRDATNAKIIVRCPNDALEKVFNTIGCITISTSRYEIEEEIKPLFAGKN